MKMYYLSHPFTGDEQKNKARATSVAAGLSVEFPDIVFINPLATFHHLFALDYDTVMAQCLELTRRCDGVIMCDGWRESRGCRIEHDEAVARWMPVWDGVDAFCEAMKGSAAAV